MQADRGLVPVSDAALDATAAEQTVADKWVVCASDEDECATVLEAHCPLPSLARPLLSKIVAVNLDL